MKLNHEGLLCLVPTGLASAIDPCILTSNFLALLGRIAQEANEGYGPLTQTGDLTEVEVATYLDCMARAAAEAMRHDTILRELDDLNALALGADFLGSISFHLITAQPLPLGKILTVVLGQVYRELLGKVFALPLMWQTKSE